MAKAFIDSTAHPKAAPFFTAFPDEPVLPSGTIRIADRVLLPSMTAEGLLDRVAKARTKEILIVAHGVPQGLSIRLLSKKGYGVLLHRGRNAKGAYQPNAVDALLDYQDGKIDRTHTSQILMMSGSELDGLTRRLAAVQKLGLTRLELRSCNVGSDPSTLQMLKRLFGAQSVCAPTQLDAYGHVDAQAAGSTAEFDRWRRQHRKGLMTYGTAPNRLAIQFRFARLRFATDAKAESGSAVASFLKTYQPGGSQTGRSFPVHGFTQRRGFVFPGDSRYRSLLKRV